MHDEDDSLDSDLLRAVPLEERVEIRFVSHHVVLQASEPRSMTSMRSLLVNLGGSAGDAPLPGVWTRRRRAGSTCAIVVATASAEPMGLKNPATGGPSLRAARCRDTGPSGIVTHFTIPFSLVTVSRSSSRDSAGAKPHRGKEDLWTARGINSLRPRTRWPTGALPSRLLRLRAEANSLLMLRLRPHRKQSRRRTPRLRPLLSELPVRHCPSPDVGPGGSPWAAARTARRPVESERRSQRP